MKRSQLNAISYSVQARKVEKQIKYLEENNLMEEFKKSKYKTFGGFLRHKGINL